MHMMTFSVGRKAVNKSPILNVRQSCGANQKDKAVAATGKRSNGTEEEHH